MITSENFAMLRKTETANSPEKNVPDSFYAKEKCWNPAYYQDSSILCFSYQEASLATFSSLFSVFYFIISFFIAYNTFVRKHAMLLNPQHLGVYLLFQNFPTSWYVFRKAP